MEHGSGWASSGNATVRLPHCSQIGLNACLPIEAIFVSISMLSNPDFGKQRLKSIHQVSAATVTSNQQIQNPGGLCNGLTHLTLIAPSFLLRTLRETRLQSDGPCSFHRLAFKASNDLKAAEH